MLHPILAAVALQLRALRLPPRKDLDSLPKVGGMGSIPSRVSDLGRAIAEIMPQVDRLHLFLHGYAEIPEVARHPRITPYLAPVDHEYRASGKFYGLLHEPAPCLYFCFDDDLLYYPGHVDRLIKGLKRYRGRAVVGIHGTRFRSPEATFHTFKRSYHFKRRLWTDHVVDMLGTGTVAFVSSAFEVRPPTWPYGDMDDIMLAIAAEKQHLPRVALSRPARSIVALPSSKTDSLWEAGRRDGTRQTEQLRILLHLMGRRPTP